VRRELRYRILLHAKNVRRKRSVRHKLRNLGKVNRKYEDFAYTAFIFSLVSISCSWPTVCFSTTTNKRFCHCSETNLTFV
jgi:hypothetical protein